MKPFFNPYLSGAIAVGSSLYSLATRQRSAVAQDSSTFPTWSSSYRGPSMPKYAYPARRAAGRRRRYMRRSYVPRFVKPRRPELVQSFVRSTLAQDWISLTASTATTTSFAFSMNQIAIADLAATFQFYRIRKIVIHLVPRVDSANSGLANNFSCQISAACDPSRLTSVATALEVLSYGNSAQKMVNSGGSFHYTFYPKVVNTVSNAGVAAQVGSYGMNPWINFSDITIAHQRLLLGLTCGNSTTLSFNGFVDFHFDCKGIS